MESPLDGCSQQLSAKGTMVFGLAGCKVVNVARATTCGKIHENPLSVSTPWMRHCIGATQRTTHTQSQIFLQLSLLSAPCEPFQTGAHIASDADSVKSQILTKLKLLIITKASTSGAAMFNTPVGGIQEG